MKILDEGMTDIGKRETHRFPPACSNEHAHNKWGECHKVYFKISKKWSRDLVYGLFHIH